MWGAALGTPGTELALTPLTSTPLHPSGLRDPPPGPSGSGRAHCHSGRAFQSERGFI